jgi:hypothetical protein
MRTIRVLLCVCVLGIAGCASNPTPTLTPPGQIAKGADQVITTADTALGVLDGLTPTVVPAEVTRNVAKALEKVGHGGKGLSAALDAYSKSQTADNWHSVQGAVAGMRSTLDAAINEITDEKIKTTVRGVLQPIFDTLLTILAILPPPTSAHNLIDLERTALVCL